MEAYYKLQLKPRSIADLKYALQVNWDSLPQEPINGTVKSSTLCLKTCAKADGEQFECTK